MRKHSYLACLAAAALTVTGCGGGGGGSSSHAQPPLASNHNLSAPTPSACPPGQSHLGCGVPHQLNLTPQKLESLPRNEGFIPDLYEGNSTFDLARVRPHIVGVIIKAWEFREDHAFVTRWNQLRAAHIWHAAYIFLRSCGEVAPYIRAVQAVGGFHQPQTGPPIIDAEVPSAGPALQCAINTAKAMTHEDPIEYTSPGSNPNHSVHAKYEWAAAYGNYVHCPFVWTANCVAWQYTDGMFGPFPHSLPGLAPGDISVSYGIQKLGWKPVKKPLPVCYHRRESKKQCAAVKKLVAEWTAAETRVVKILHKNHCRQPYRRLVCRTNGRTFNHAFNHIWRLRRAN